MADQFSGNHYLSRHGVTDGNAYDRGLPAGGEFLFLYVVANTSLPKLAANF